MTNQTQYKGLTTKEAEKKRVDCGENRLATVKKIRPAKIFIAQFKDLMTVILLLSTVLSVMMGEIVEAATIIAIVLINAVLGFFQEFRTEKSLEKLSALSAPMAAVVRDGKIVTIATTLLVPGDLVLIKAGDRIPADCKLLENSSLQCDESILSGESLPVEKGVTDHRANDVSDKVMVFMGTLATRGNAKGLVVHTGLDTQMGQIASMLEEIEPEQTPLQKKLDQMGKYIAFGCILICAVVSVTGILRGEPIFDMVITGISLSVAAIPEGLPAIVTIALALSVNRMVKRNAVVRKLHAVETLGCANVICSDKTGTLTENKMTVKTLRTADFEVEVTGTGYEKKGQLLLSGRAVNLAAIPPLCMAVDIAAVCNNTVLEAEKGRAAFRVFGEPTEAALAIAASKAGRLKESCGYTVLSELPFDSDRKMMSVVVRSRAGELYLFTKGGSDVLLARCSLCATQSGVTPMTQALRTSLNSANEAMAGSALRVLGLCYRKILSPTDLGEAAMTFAAFAGMQDPPRKEALDAVLRCRRANIRPVMITGDSKLTAAAIAKELKILTVGDKVLTGKEMDLMSDIEFADALPITSVFARVSPAHKLKIVRGLKAQGNVVAMTGDGVNDAPAVKEANIGVSMGISGTDVTKEASSVILMDDNFATLVAAVEEGRVIYRNIRKFIRYLLSCNIGEVVTMFFAMLMGMPVPLLPIQILLINLVTDGLPAIALGLDPPDSDVMSKKPRRTGDSIFSDGLLSVIIFRGFLIGLTTLAVFSAFLTGTGSLALARTGALFTLVVTQLIHVFECKSEEKSLFQINVWNNLKLMAAVLLSALVLCVAVYHPVAQVLFRTVALSWEQLVTILGYLLVAPMLWAFISHFRYSKRKKFVQDGREMPASSRANSAAQHNHR